MNNYNTIAPIYDFLAQLVYGNDILKAQKTYLTAISENDNVLIIGGGSGKILLELLKIQPNCRIDYVEASDIMIDLAKQKVHAENINFIHGTEQELKQKYDVIITAFFLDLFPFEKLLNVLQKLDMHLNANGLLLATDFYPNKSIRAKILYGLMKSFFSITTGLKSKKLYNFDDILQQLFKKQAIHFYNKGFIFSGCYRKLF